MNRKLSFACLASLVMFTTSCKERKFNNETEVKEFNRVSKQTLPFNALKMLEDPKVAAVLSYPKNYEKPGFNVVVQYGSKGLFSVESDQVFFSASSEWFGSRKTQKGIGGGEDGVPRGGGANAVADFVPIALPTTYATVKTDNRDNQMSGGYLAYQRDGRALLMKMSEEQSTEATHEDAIEACEKMNMRLPTARELFDFCVAYEDGEKGLAHASPPTRSRCSFRNNWTVTLKADTLKNAWTVIGSSMSWSDRSNKEAFRCLGEYVVKKSD